MNELDQEQQKKQQREVRIEQLKTMETWGDAHGEELEQQKREFSQSVIAFQTHYDEQMIAQMKANAPHAEVTAVAQVPHPPVQAPAANEGYKARREREKKRREARKICPVGDEYTLDMARDIKQSNACRHLVETPELDEMARASHSDMRAMKVFCQDFRLDKKGRPATDEDDEILQANRKFISDYASGSAELREPHLDRITQQMLNIQLTPDMFTPENLVKHAAEYKLYGDMFTYFENIQKENPDYFDALPQLKKDLLQTQITAGVAFTAAFAQQMNARGIDFNQGEVYTEREPIQMGEAMKEALTQQYHLELTASQAHAVNAYDRESERLTAASREELFNAFKQQDALLSKEYGVSFPGGATELQYNDLKSYRELIADYPEKYSENKELIDKVFSDYYKVLSEMGELTLTTRARQGVVDDNNAFLTSDPLRLKLAGAALKGNERDMERINALSHYGNELMDIMQHILKGKPLLASAAAVMARYKTSSTAPTGDEAQ